LILVNSLGLPKDQHSPSSLQYLASVHDKKNLLVDAAVLLALVAIGAAGYWYSPLLLPKSDVIGTADAGCDLHRQACGATLPDGGRLELSITPRPIPMVQPLGVEVRLSDIEAGRVEIDFLGIDMNMGYNRPQLTPAGAGRFVGSASLPVCITGSMAWQATVLLESGQRRISVPFRFNSAPQPL
jgi:hypothetical protein